jgi:4-amino-4-deoxy-L-arabinose transferase-like glycosyltransferase
MSTLPDHLGGTPLPSSRSLARIALLVCVLLAVASCAHLIAAFGWFRPPASLALWLHLAYGWWAALALLLAQYRLGCDLARLPLLGEWGVSGWAAALFRWALGTWCLACLILLTLLGLPTGLGMACTATLVAFLTARSLWQLGRIAFQPVPPPGPGQAAPIAWSLRGKVSAVGVGMLWFAPYFLQTLLPNTDWDGAMYHLPLAQRLLTESPWSVDPCFLYYDFPSLPYLFYALFLWIGAETAVVPFVLLTSLAVVVAVFALTERFWGRAAALWATAVLLTVNVLWEVGVTPRIDNFLTLFFLLAVFAFLLWRENPQPRGLLPLIGLLLGLALSTKYTAIFFLPLLGGSVGLVAALQSSHRRGLWGKSGFLALFLVLTPSAFWYVRNGLVLGDPVYPLGRQRMVYESDEGRYRSFDDLLREHAGLLPSEDKVDAVLSATEFHFLLGPPQATHLHATHLFNLWDVFCSPDKYDTKPGHSLGPFVLLGFLLPLWARDRTSLWLYGIGLGLYFLLAWQTYVLRYILPALALFACASGVVLSRLVVRMGERFRFVRPVLLALLGIYLGALFAGQVLKLREMHPWQYLAGAESPIDFLCHAGYNGARWTPPVLAFINRQVEEQRIPAETAILMVGEGKGERLRCRYLPDASPPGYRWVVEFLKAGGDATALKQRLRRQGIGYLLINVEFIRWSYHFSEAGFDTRYLKPTFYFLIEFAKNHCTPVYERDGIWLGRLK